MTYNVFGGTLNPTLLLCYYCLFVLLVDNTNGLLLATDVAARGLDIPGVQHVIHYQVPRTTEVRFYCISAVVDVHLHTQKHFSRFQNCEMGHF